MVCQVLTGFQKQGRSCRPCSSYPPSVVNRGPVVLLPSPTSGPSLKKQHGVAVAEEPVSLLHRTPVRLADPLHAAKRHDEREKRGPGQGEMGAHGVHHAETVPGIDELPRRTLRGV